MYLDGSCWWVGLGTTLCDWMEKLVPLFELTPWLSRVSPHACHLLVIVDFKFDYFCMVVYVSSCRVKGRSCDNYSIFWDVQECFGMFRNFPRSCFHRRPHARHRYGTGGFNVPCHTNLQLEGKADSFSADYLGLHVCKGSLHKCLRSRAIFLFGSKLDLTGRKMLF